MASDKDPYEVLGVARDATLEKIRRKYRKLLRKFHPNVVAPDGDPERGPKVKVATVNTRR